LIFKKRLEVYTSDRPYCGVVSFIVLRRIQASEHVVQAEKEVAEAVDGINPQIHCLQL
jgi:hypothetical protein